MSAFRCIPIGYYFLQSLFITQSLLYTPSYCASLLRTQNHMPCHASLSTQMNNDRQMAIAIALLGIDDLGRSVTPTFRLRKRFYLPLSPHCLK